MKIHARTHHKHTASDSTTIHTVQGLQNMPAKGMMLNVVVGHTRPAKTWVCVDAAPPQWGVWVFLLLVHSCIAPPNAPSNVVSPSYLPALRMHHAWIKRAPIMHAGKFYMSTAQGCKNTHFTALQRHMNDGTRE